MNSNCVASITGLAVSHLKSESFRLQAETRNFRSLIKGMVEGKQKQNKLTEARQTQLNHHKACNSHGEFENYTNVAKPTGCQFIEKVKSPCNIFRGKNKQEGQRLYLSQLPYL